MRIICFKFQSESSSSNVDKLPADIIQNNIWVSYIFILLY